ncbi:MAG: glycosyltransferase family 4 protein [Candidatus Eisenbacteria bacterium]|nr:glycosyltransferase family 4 protein [Candidatus Eisenbacteria bacterium]
MKIAIIKPILPYPLDQGARRVTHQILEALHGENELTLITRLTSKDEQKFIPDLSKLCSRIIAPLAPNKRSFFHRVAYRIFYLLKSVLLLRPAVVSYSCPGVLRKQLRALSKNVEFDVLQVENWYSWPLAKDVRSKVKILLAHDIDFRVTERRLSLPGAGPGRFLKRLTGWCEKRAELRALNESDAIFTLTDEDSRAVKECVGRDSSVLPFCGSTDLAGDILEKREERSILFLGSFRADFNRDAAAHMVNEIFPLVKKNVPDAKLYLVGSFPTEKIFSFSGSGVVVAGNVQDVGQYFGMAQVFALPLRYGGGLRVRLFEAMAHGMAVVTTRIGRSGVPGEDGVHFLVRESPQEFALGLSTLLKDRVLRERLGKNARDLIKNKCNKADTFARIRALYRSQSHSETAAS